MILPPPTPPLFPYTTLFRSQSAARGHGTGRWCPPVRRAGPAHRARSEEHTLNSSHEWTSYAVFCLKKKKDTYGGLPPRRRTADPPRASRPSSHDPPPPQMHG